MSLLSWICSLYFQPRTHQPKLNLEYHAKSKGKLLKIVHLANGHLKMGTIFKLGNHVKISQRGWWTHLITWCPTILPTLEIPQKEGKGSWIWEGKKEKQNWETPGEAKLFGSWGLCVKKKKMRNPKCKKKLYNGKGSGWVS